MQAIDLEGKYHDVSSEEITWRVHVYGIVINGDKVLLSPQHDGYDLPGGKVELGEHLEEAVAREVKEETGLEVRPTKLLGVNDTLFKVTFREPQEVWHSVMVYYECEMVGGNITTQGFDEYEKDYAQAAEWISLEKLDSITRASSVDYVPFIKKALEQHNVDQ